MSENNKSNLSLKVSVTDVGIFEDVLAYIEELMEVLHEYPLSDEHRHQLNKISEKFGCTLEQIRNA
jgi:hypothetical protein